MAHKFKSGDIVKLKKGSPSMTVKGNATKPVNIGNVQIADKYECMWFDGLKSQKAIFQEDAIELV
ncbi:MAG TPA: DUF2158 domain-containing protein [Chitinophagaceae bacterium]|nr:DUF2158 domain-containing protein [Chitinophagaceae bacterium]